MNRNEEVENVPSKVYPYYESMLLANVVLAMSRDHLSSAFAIPQDTTVCLLSYKD